MPDATSPTTTDPDDTPVVLVSNRGPVSYAFDDDGAPQARRGAGGLVSGLAPLVAGTSTGWIAAAMSDAERAAATDGMTEADGFRVRLLDIDPSTFRASYDVVCNATLWFVHHGLFEAARRPRIDRRWHEAWAAYEEVNRAFAQAVAEEAPDGAIVLVQDYHLCLVGEHLRTLRPDLSSVHFSHTPFSAPDGLRILPDAVAERLLSAMAAHDACGFHSPRWADRFEACCDEVLSSRPRTFVSPLAPDPEDLADSAARAATAEAGALLDEQVGDRALILRVDRIELSKNLLRGFWAYEELLERFPEWREQVVFGAFVYPSREGLTEYLAYRQEVETTIERINDTHSTSGWTPILAELSDNYPRSVAALQRYDVLLVNPVRDGLNLVAKEGPLLNERDGVVVLSTEAGAYDELAGHVSAVNPFDVSATAEALDAALRLDAATRAERASRLREVAARRTPRDWFAEQLVAAHPTS